MAVKGGLFKTKAKQAEAEKVDSALDKYFKKATSEYEEKALEAPHHSENCDNVSRQTDDVIPDSQRGSLCPRSEVSHFGSVESDREGSSSACASNESYEHGNSKFAGTIGWTNDPVSWPGVFNRNVRGYLIQIGPSTITTKFLAEKRVIGRFKFTAKENCQKVKRHVIHVSTSLFRA